MGRGRKSKPSKASKPRAGTPIKKSSPVKGGVGRKQNRLVSGGKAAAGAIISDIPIAGTLLRAGQSAKAAAGSRQTAPRGGFGARKKGKIPKSVRRWASRIVSRRKQEEKLVKKLFGAEGGKIIKKKSKSTPLDGIITRQEALKALRT